jgi:diadenosine tetraphosphatase ApaH/serine/threonine PP2A family protein phosphatase
MLIALMADIHGNREALAACLAHAEAARVERHVFLGDYVGYGADPGWVVDTIVHHVERGAVAVGGNHDAAVSTPDVHMNAVARTAIAWTRGELDEAQRAFLASLPLTAEDDESLFVHANAWAPGNWGYILDELNAGRSLRATARVYTFCGHVHVPALYHMPMTASDNVDGGVPASNVAVPLAPRRRWLAVLGAVGQPRDGNATACYGLFDTVRHTLTFVRVPYDAERAARKIIAAGLPPSLGARLLVGH